MAPSVAGGFPAFVPPPPTVVLVARVTGGRVTCGGFGSEPDWSGQPSHALLFSDD